MNKKKISLILLLVLASVYFISQFLRSALGITGLSISEDFQLNYEQLGRLGGIFFLSFALMQVPLGIILDKINPLKIIFFMLIIIYLGTLLLSFSNSFELIFFARILQGIGCSACLMGPLVYIAKKSSKESFSKLSGIIMGLGGLGALFAFSPFYELTLILGWKVSFFVFSFLILGVIAAIFYYLTFEKNYLPSKNCKTEISSFIFIFTNKNFLMILPMSIFGYASFAFLLTLWGSKFLILKQTINELDIANILMFTALFWSLGSIFFGYAIQKISKNKTLVIFSASTLIFLLILLALKEINNYNLILSIFCIYGFLGAFTLLVLDHYRKLFNQDILGRVLTCANLFNFGGVFFVQWITGLLIEFTTEKVGFSFEKAFSASFLMVSFFLFLSILFYFKSDEAKP
ncbi:MAG: hypothetical protein CFH34_01123 [Alphaproteobacteria bacterium MarineAlpha9_Bin4]|mgnify:CR=1 FL=1|nr:hypothetical protein [Pelagibacterales bacterium]PPR26127.1 MAG: hypothetical protein CFH34_01123 [Alphaproteobacteria bacterium MarineAlpha9_Bin4]|tara:strand:+ start:732 stop:1943 length:1212 start_codon:yes stop_codon:yes gene_type:complete